MQMNANKILPVEIVFTPKWWHDHAGIVFDEPFFFDKDRRVNDELKMRNYLYNYFQIDGLGEKEVVKKPVIGPVHLAAGYIIPQLFGCDIKYHRDGPPDILPLNLNDKEVLKLKIPDFKSTFPVNKIIQLMDDLENEYGYIEGDIDWSGVLNHAIDLRGQTIFMDMFDDNMIAKHLFDVIYHTIVEFANYIKSRTGSSSISVNRQTKNFAPTINLHSNCAVQMISNEMYEKHLLYYDIKLSKNLQPYGIHHCGNNMDNVAAGYAKVPDVCFFDVGYGSDIRKCREYLSDAFFNLRLSPVKIKNCSKDEVVEDILRLVDQNGGIANAGISCINMDSLTSDENIRAIYETAAALRK